MTPIQTLLSILGKLDYTIGILQAQFTIVSRYNQLFILSNAIKTLFRQYILLPFTIPHRLSELEAAIYLYLTDELTLLQ